MSLAHSNLTIGNKLIRKSTKEIYVVSGRDEHMVTLQGGSNDDILWFAVSRSPLGIPIPNPNSFFDVDKILDEFESV